MTPFGSITQAICALVVGGLLTGCVELRPYRTSWDTSPNYPPQVDCTPDQSTFNVPDTCASRIWEHSEQYDLLFTEFTDQGLQYPSQQYPTAAFQINHTLEVLNRIAKAPRTNGISLVVYVHGWHHGASSADSDVRRFREILQATALAERLQDKPFNVVGVYVGWRGASLDLGSLNYLTFWNRAEAADRVAQGSTRELFNRLRSFRCEQNQTVLTRGRPTAAAEGDCTWSGKRSQGRPKVATMMVGHSFGAKILYNALAGSLLEALIQPQGTRGQDTVSLRYADLVVLLNPAFEATQYTPLHRVAAPPESDYRRSYHPPMLVSVTTSADWATRVAHPIGRTLGSVNEATLGREESVAARYTQGHMTGDGSADDPTNYITHSLTHDTQSAETCYQLQGQRISQAASSDPARYALQAEVAYAQRYVQQNAKLTAGHVRRFCGGVTLTHRNHDPNSVVWNVRSDASIMNGHNDVMNDNLIDFVRQLYLETVVWRWRRESVAPGSTQRNTR